MHVLNIQLTEAELAIVGQALNLLPHGQVRPVIERIDVQVKAFIANLNKVPEVEGAVIEKLSKRRAPRHRAEKDKVPTPAKTVTPTEPAKV